MRVRRIGASARDRCECTGSTRVRGIDASGRDRRVCAGSMRVGGIDARARDRCACAGSMRVSGIDARTGSTQVCGIGASMHTTWCSRRSRRSHRRRGPHAAPFLQRLPNKACGLFSLNNNGQIANGSVVSFLNFQTVCVPTTKTCAQCNLLFLDSIHCS